MSLLGCLSHLLVLALFLAALLPAPINSQTPPPLISVNSTAAASPAPLTNSAIPPTGSSPANFSTADTAEANEQLSVFNEEHQTQFAQVQQRRSPITRVSARSQPLSSEILLMIFVGFALTVLCHPALLCVGRRRSGSLSS